MFRKMRRFKQQLEDSDAMAVLKNGHRGVLSLIGDDGYPYGVPVNYYCGEDGHIYIHCAGEGHKIDALKSNDKVTFPHFHFHSMHFKRLLLKPLDCGIL